MLARLQTSKPVRKQTTWLQGPDRRGSGIRSRRTRVSMTTNEPHVIIEERGAWGLITLNRPKALNALNSPIVDGLTAAYSTWLAHPLAHDTGVHATLVRGAGDRAFCAGGDVKTVVLQAKEGNWQEAVEFFRAEYTLDYLISRMASPRGGGTGPQSRCISQVSLMDGFVMGGGAGLAMAGAFRVATERTVFAMPECSIGLFPDVGGSIFLNQLQPGLGLFLALTGYQVRGVDVLRGGLATHFVPSKEMPALEAALLSLDRGKAADMTRIDACIRQFSVQDDTHAPGEANFLAILDVAQRCFSGSVSTSVQSIVSALLQLKGQAHADSSAICATALSSMDRASPLSLCVAHEQLRRGATMSSMECFEMEFGIVARCLRGPSDFQEGVRCRLIDRADSPVWVYPDLESVDRGHVETFFNPIDFFPKLNLDENHVFSLCRDACLRL